MKRRRYLLAGVTVLVGLAVAGVWICSHLVQPPGRVFFDHIKLGMHVDEVNRLVLQDPTAEPSRSYRWQYWQLRVGNEVHNVSCSYENSDPVSESILEHLQYLDETWDQKRTTPGVMEARDVSVTRMK